jgi:hypothetical protein
MRVTGYLLPARDRPVRPDLAVIRRRPAKRPERGDQLVVVIAERSARHLERIPRDDARLLVAHHVYEDHPGAHDATRSNRSSSRFACSNRFHARRARGDESCGLAYQASSATW